MGELPKLPLVIGQRERTNWSMDNPAATPEFVNPTLPHAEERPTSAGVLLRRAGVTPETHVVSDATDITAQTVFVTHKRKEGEQ